MIVSFPKLLFSSLLSCVVLWLLLVLVLVLLVLVLVFFFCHIISHFRIVLAFALVLAFIIVLIIIPGSGCPAQVLTSNPLVESWGHFPRSRKRLLDLLQRTDPAGLVILSGDVHHAELASGWQASPPAPSTGAVY